MPMDPGNRWPPRKDGIACWLANPWGSAGGSENFIAAQSSGFKEAPYEQRPEQACGGPKAAFPVRTRLTLVGVHFGSAGGGEIEFCTGDLNRSGGAERGRNSCFGCSDHH